MPDLATPTRAVPALTIDGLTYSYPNAPHEALRDISLHLHPGEFAVLAGRSASGKSTLLRGACGLVPHFHGGEITGQVNVAGLDAIASGPGELASAVGYVAQDPETQIVSTTVAAEIELPLEMRGDSPASRARAVEEVALALAIPHLLDRTVDTLSGGELQRVALAAALVTRPRLVLLDEPTSQLDPVAGDELIWLLRRLNEEWGVAILLAEHRLERCLAAADRVVAMDAGAIAFDGPPRDFQAWSHDADPALTTPAARLFSLAGIDPLPVGVREARQILDSKGCRGRGVGPPLHLTCSGGEWSAGRGRIAGKVQDVPRGSDPPSDRPALDVRGLWVELSRGDEPHDVLRGLDLTMARGERIALMGRNGAGKSTLLRTAAGLVDSVRGRVETADGMVLLTQNPSDYLVRERVGDELPGEAGMEALRIVGLEHAVDSDPRDLSGGERQRLALAIALAGRMEGEKLSGLVALDEPTRGMDRSRRDELVELIGGISEHGAGVLVATHDVEFAAAFAERVVLLGRGCVIADGPVKEILSGGWYFATEVARVLDLPRVITPEQGAAVLNAEVEDL
ncbi:MAG TPA: ATP-binding cassette domain-containing protein [Solirubrobacterales bacterium]|jgi:energy-coupling factor transporter ATP-binding protein EcfA2|nr:ATP-binding cassette domain-containing protein [Solirubrobacterales bacterium]